MSDLKIDVRQRLLLPASRFRDAFPGAPRRTGSQDRGSRFPRPFPQRAPRVLPRKSAFPFAASARSASRRGRRAGVARLPGGQQRFQVF